MATEYNLQKIIEDIEVRTDFQMSEVKVPIIFSARKDGRYVFSEQLLATHCIGFYHSPLALL